MDQQEEMKLQSEQSKLEEIKLPREITADELKADQAYIEQLAELAGNDNPDFKRISALVTQFIKSASHSKITLDQSDRKTRDRNHSSDIAYNATSRTNQWAAGFDDEVSQAKKDQIAAFTEEQNKELDELETFFNIIKKAVAEKNRQKNLLQTKADAEEVLKNEKALRIAQNNYKQATDELIATSEKMQPLNDDLELANDRSEEATATIEELEAKIKRAKTTIKLKGTELRQQLNKLEQSRDKMTADNKDELQELEKMKAFLIKIIDLSNIYIRDYLEAPADRTTTNLMDGKYGNMETAYAQRARNLLKEWKDEAAFVKYEVKKDLEKLSDVDEAIQGINKEINEMIQDFDDKHKTEICKAKCAYDKAVEALAQLQIALEEAKNAESEAQKSAEIAKNNVDAAEADNGNKRIALENAQKELNEIYARYRQSAVDAKAFTNAMLEGNRTEKEETIGVPEVAEKMFFSNNGRTR